MFTRSRSDLRKNRNLTNTDLDTVTNKMGASSSIKNHPMSTKNQAGSKTICVSDTSAIGSKDKRHHSSVRIKTTKAVT